MESFSQETKTDLCALFLKKRCCRTAFLRGAVCFGACVKEDRIALSTENEAFADLYCKMMQSVFGIHLSPLTGEEMVIDDPVLIKRILETFGDLSSLEVSDPVFRGCESDRAAFLRGVFLACGTITEPEIDYHLELIPQNDRQGEMLAGFLTDCDLAPKVLHRRSCRHATLYYKDSSAMEDFLNFIGAQKSAFKLMDVKIIKDLRNNANRIRNCDMANVGKTISASQEQMDAILKIMSQDRAADLPDDLRETFDLRAANPSVSLADLAAMHKNPISKSGVSHRLARLIAFSKYDPDKAEEEKKEVE